MTDPIPAEPLPVAGFVTRLSPPYLLDLTDLNM